MGVSARRGWYNRMKLYIYTYKPMRNNYIKYVACDFSFFSSLFFFFQSSYSCRVFRLSSLIKVQSRNQILPLNLREIAQWRRTDEISRRFSPPLDLSFDPRTLPKQPFYRTFYNLHTNVHLSRVVSSRPFAVHPTTTPRALCDVWISGSAQKQVKRTKNIRKPDAKENNEERGKKKYT